MLHWNYNYRVSPNSELGSTLFGIILTVYSNLLENVMGFADDTPIL